MKLLTESIEVTELSLSEDRFGYMNAVSMRSINGSITLKFVSSGNFSQFFLKKNGRLKREKLLGCILMSLSKIEIEL